MCMRKLDIYIRCCIVMLLCSLPAAATAKGADDDNRTATCRDKENGCCRQMEKQEFVRTEDGKFFVGEREYRFIGTNFWYGAILGSTGTGGNRERLKAELDDMAALGIDNVRILVGGDGRDSIPSHIAPKLQTEPGVYDERLLEGLDYVIAELEKRGMRAVLYMNNAWEWSGGYGAYLDWAGFSGEVDSSDGKGKKFFRQTPVPSIDGWWEYMQYVGNFMLNDKAKAMAAQHVKNIVSRVNGITGRAYKDSPAIMAWEIANEPRCFVNDELHRRKFVEWIDEQSRMIKAIDPNHLVTTGSEGVHGCEESVELFQAIHRLPCIDYVCIHIWPNNWGWIGKFNQNYDAEKTIAEGAPDPIVDNVGAACDSTMGYIRQAIEAVNTTYRDKDGVTRNGRRPVVVEEFGYPRDRFLFNAGSPTKGRDAYYKALFAKVEDGTVAGCNFWGWGGRAKVRHTIWQRWDDYVCDPAQEEQGLNSVFATDTSTLDIIRQSVERMKENMKQE